MNIISGTEPLTEAQLAAFFKGVMTVAAATAGHATEHEAAVVAKRSRCLECHRVDGKHNSRCPHREAA